MITCLDVDYRTNGACAAAVVFQDWADAQPVDEVSVHLAKVEAYVSGEFYRRELPCLQAVIEKLPPVEILIVDGYVWLDGPGKPGLGAHLYRALAERIPIVGVAKTRFQGADGVVEVLRGASLRPLYISAVGIPVDFAASQVRAMHGAHRIPSLIARVDRLCRDR